MPVLLLAAVDDVARRSAALGLLLDLPSVVVVTHDLVVGHDGGGAVRRTITDRSGVLAEETTPLDHACLACAVREDLLPTLQMLLNLDRWSTVAVSLPLTAAPEPVAYEIGRAIGDGSLQGAVLASVVSLVDLATFEADLLGDELLDERGLAFGDYDRRSVGEAVAAQVEFADDVVTVDRASAAAETLLAHLVAPTSRLHVGWDSVAADHLVGVRHDTETARRRMDPLQVQPSSCRDEHGIWTVELSAHQPLDPGRLLRHVEALGSGRVRARGHFWLASRPDVACVWDGSGGQLAIGHLGPWRQRRPGSRIVVTGSDPDDRRRIVDTFSRVLTTAADLSTAWASQLVDDGFTPWLGPLPTRTADRETVEDPSPRPSTD
ncbi:CobW family GTP-binding protein [uncultured Friedmanniella sp.]|uniref:CobW family GTP-binding protein n=1 Tax=uncultured Friedmanniella sp. TaxID=335381 RepID=UPI0035C9AABE